MILRTSLLLLVASSVATSPAMAQSAQAPTPRQPAQQAKQGKDPNEVVCEREQDPGSRLASAKVCHTRAEWADLRHQDRQMLDQAQTLRGTPNGH